MKTFSWIITLIISFSATVRNANASLDTPDCIQGSSSSYRGTQNYTRSGKPCQRWNNVFHGAIPQDGGEHNHCRNPNIDLRGTWCYVSQNSKEFCNIPKCDDDSKVIWTNYDDTNHIAHVLWMHADPEVIRTETDAKGVFNVSVLFLSNSSYSEFYAVTGDYQRNKLFYTDYVSEFIGVRDLRTHETDVKLHGMARGIENLAYDWLSENLYWTDSFFKWVMAADRDFRFYTPIYRSEDSRFYAITIHSKLRKLFFSSFHPGTAKIFVSDLAGHNATVVLQNPQIDDVSGLTIDYVQNKLYFTNHDGFGSTLMRAELDGSNVVRFADGRGSLFWNVASYGDFLYVTDLIPHVGTSGSSDIQYHVWFISKKNKSVNKYKIKGQPRGITVMTKNEYATPNASKSDEECHSNSLPACDHICLPRIGAKRECRCSLGYAKKNDTKCVTNTFYDEFLLVSDAGQGKIFQVPFNQNKNLPPSYGIMEVTESEMKNYRVTTVAVDTRTREVFWSDKELEKIKKSPIDGSVITTLSHSAHASYMTVDPCTQNIYYIESSTQSIKVMDSSGTYTKTLKKTFLTVDSNTSIQMLAQDLVNKKLYWTDTRSQRGKGQVWRMNLDGSNKELVFDLLEYPVAITVDNKNKQLFVCEAKSAMIYMQPLSQLQTITNTSHLSIERQFDMAAHLFTSYPFILDIKVYDDLLYFYDGTNYIESGKISIRRFNLTTGPDSIEYFGPSEFFVIKSMAIYSSSYDSASYDCSATPCSQNNLCLGLICVSVNENDANETANLEKRCLCQDGFVMKDDSCIDTGDINTPPDYGTTCPEDIVIKLPPCANHVTQTWKDPTWTDDFTAQPHLKITKPNLEKLTVGRHNIRYTAEDKHNATSVCLFMVTVKGQRCLNLTLPSYLTATPKSCGFDVNSHYSVSCKSASDQMFFNRTRSDNITFECGENGHWLPYGNYDKITCAPLHTTEGPITKQPIESTSNTIQRTKEISVIFTNVADKNNGATADSNVPSKSSSVSTTSIAVGALIAGIIIIALLVFGILMFRRKGSLCLIKINFPKLWKTRSDSVTLRENTGSSNLFDVM